MEGHNSSEGREQSCLNRTLAEVVVVMVPFPAQGHLNQLLHLSHLMTSYGLAVHYAGSSTHNRQAKLRIQGWDADSLSKIHFHDLELPSYDSLPPNPDNSNHFPRHLQPLFDASLHLRQPVCQLLQQLKTKFSRVVVVHDSLMATVVQDVHSIPNAETYSFISISAFTFFFNSWEKLQQKPFPLDSDIPKFLPSNDGCFTPEILNIMIQNRKMLGLESGRLYNTSKVVEGKYIQLLAKLSTNNKMKHFAIGPLNPVQMKSKNGKYRHTCLEWLDKQETASVIYISFGSTTSMTDEQIMELALGLERSGQKFIWVLRRADTGDIFTGGEVGKPQLPEGYEDRVKNRGIVVKDWAPQLEILAHPSTGGFMSYCGWNSSMESISMGVPVAAWPMHSDQPRNAFFMTDVLRIGVLVRDWTRRAELVPFTTIDTVLRTLMASKEGEEMRKRAAELGDAVQASVAKDGASRLEMDSFISHITR
ncbi:zeatin O-glucosyltransferase-like [Chenopodium quinoa]|uniref:zeatin O-glucosyltransferase-like n=1 Tax=Chenopodium quinoa TaxID=63459 RepID=UPI000B76BED9|nr:zeatin O-glucosyltransferase-like [Chenopodium quinoa]